MALCQKFNMVLKPSRTTLTVAEAGLKSMNGINLYNEGKDAAQLPILFQRRKLKTQCEQIHPSLANSS